MSPKNIYITRHPQTEYNVADIFQGRSDSPLSEKGKEDLEKMKQFFSQLPIDVIFTSPLMRCKRTTSAINELLQVELVEKNRLAEICYGQWEEHTKKEIKQNDIWKKRELNRINFKHPGDYQGISGESYIDGAERLKPFWSELVESQYQNILVVGHLGTLLAAKMYFEKSTDTLLNKYRPENNTVLHIYIGEKNIVEEIQLPTCKEAQVKESFQSYNLLDFTKGWIVGDFEPSIIRTKETEVSIKEYKKGDKEDLHVHKLADEITVVVSGVFKMNGHVVKKNDIVHLKKNEPADFECLEDGINVVIKIPSVIGDKHIISKS